MCSLRMLYLNVCPLHTCYQNLFLTHVSSTRVSYKGLTYTCPSRIFPQHVSLIKVWTHVDETCVRDTCMLNLNNGHMLMEHV
jgi:hypothetical protein